MTVADTGTDVAGAPGAPTGSWVRLVTVTGLLHRAHGVGTGIPDFDRDLGRLARRSRRLADRELSRLLDPGALR